MWYQVTVKVVANLYECNVYGSAKTCSDLWKKNGIDYTAEDVVLYNKEIAEGPFGIANMFKEFIINNCNPQADMDIVIGDEEFSISCNRYRNVGERTKAYKIWDSIDRRYNVVLRTETKQVPDLEQFRRFFVTLLIHNRDAAVMDKVVNRVMDKHQFALPIHDAAVVSPAAAADTRQWYAEELESMHKNRKSILQGYFRSIGITAAAEAEWERLQGKIHNLEGELVVNHMALK